MEYEGKFRQVNARHVVSEEGAHVEFVNSHEVDWRRDDLHVRFNAERVVDAQGYPDGRIVESSSLRIIEGSPPHREEIRRILNDLRGASTALRTKITIV